MVVLSSGARGHNVGRIKKAEGMRRRGEEGGGFK